jgi:hypothetical protein
MMAPEDEDDEEEYSTECIEAISGVSERWSIAARPARR